MDGTNLLRIEERTLCILLMPCRILGGTVHVVLYVNLANCSTTLGGNVYIEYNLHGTTSVVRGHPPWKYNACVEGLAIHLSS